MTENKPVNLNDINLISKDYQSKINLLNNKVITVEDNIDSVNEILVEINTKLDQLLELGLTSELLKRLDKIV